MRLFAASRGCSNLTVKRHLSGWRATIGFQHRRTAHKPPATRTASVLEKALWEFPNLDPPRGVACRWIFQRLAPWRPLWETTPTTACQVQGAANGATRSTLHQVPKATRKPRFDKTPLRQTTHLNVKFGGLAGVDATRNRPGKVWMLKRILWLDSVQVALPSSHAWQVESYCRAQQHLINACVALNIIERYSAQ